MKTLMSIIVMVVLMTMPISMQAEWQTVVEPSESNANLYWIDVTPNGTVHVVGEYGKYLINHNDGNGFMNQPYLGSFDYKKIIAINDSVLYICGGGSGGAIKKSTDGGQTWDGPDTLLNTMLNDIAFWNADSGIAVGNDGIILRTVDGGTNWIQINSTTTSDLKGITLDSAGLKAIIVGRNGTILSTIDNGRSWTQITSPTTNSLYCVDMNGAWTIGYAAGYQGVMLKTTNSGQTWTQITSPSYSSSLYSINLVSSYGLMGGLNGNMFNTTNSGETWEQMNTNITNTIRSIFLKDSIAWVVGDNGFILYNPAIPIINSSISSVVPTSCKLLINYPNPFNPSTTITYSLTSDDQVNLLIYNSTGQLITQLIDEYQSAGTYQVNFQAIDLPSGIYFYQLSTPSFTETKKMVLVK